MPFETTVGRSDLELGQEYFGSTVTNVDQDVTTEVEDGIEIYKIKRTVTLRTGMILIEEYKREKSLGEIKSKKYGYPEGHLDDDPKDDSEARARARAMMKKKKGKPKKNKSVPSPGKKSRGGKPRKSKSIPKNRGDLEGVEPWFNFDQPEKEVKTAAPRPKRRPKVEEPDPCFFDTDFDAFPAKILPESQAPSTQEDDKPYMGVWKHDDGTDDSNWDPLNVIVTKDPPTDIEPETPHGIVCIAESLQPKSVGKLRPDQLKFLPPGKKPPAFFKPVGHWRPKKLNADWPPKKAKPKKSKSVGKLSLDRLNIYDVPTKIVPISKLAETKENEAPVIGCWKHNDNTDDSEWEPMDAVITRELPDDLETGEPHGLVAVKEGVRPNKAGKLKPEQLKFFGPGEEPPSNFVKVGHWRPGKLKADWPPLKPEVEKKLQDVGKLKLEEVWQEKIPETAIIYPFGDCPDCHDESKEQIIAKGVWKFNDQEEPPEGSESWVPTYVQLGIDGDVDVCQGGVVENSDAPEGVWGLNPSDDANALNPADLWFYPPDEEMDMNFEPIGKWKMLKEKYWPPKSIGQVEDKRQFKVYKGSLNNVGKLKMPTIFGGK